jgi:hypothetical protein
MVHNGREKQIERSPFFKEVFRYWVELRDLRSDVTRSLPLTAIAVIHIPRKKSEPQKPDEEVLQLHDDAVIIEAKNLDDLAAQLKAKYPDELYERTLHRERDHDAERRRADALSGLMDILVKSVVDEVLRDAQVVDHPEEVRRILACTTTRRP